MEFEAKQAGLTYVKLDGDVGIIGNGAGLVMTTLDMVARVGGKPANFLDIGGGAKAETMYKALTFVARDPQVKGILVNIFGGITRGEEVAKGVIMAQAELPKGMPIVVRLSGSGSPACTACTTSATAVVHTTAILIIAILLKWVSLYSTNNAHIPRSMHHKCLHLVLP